MFNKIKNIFKITSSDVHLTTVDGEIGTKTQRDFNIEIINSGNETRDMIRFVIDSASETFNEIGDDSKSVNERLLALANYIGCL